MADIELGDYIAEIEEMLTAEKNDEVIAHCRHILDYFPKNLASYRFLGKGLLEKRRFQDAADILYRVLSVAPDDFVAHVGLAIIGEEEENLAQSAGHMARAFDTQPNNGAIQSELKRLYGRRDGVEPARIRLTQGALARLYIRGGNHGQAVKELRGALWDTPDRIDLKVLLATALWKDEQRIDAVEVCQEVLERLPYCLRANRILYEIWQSAGRDDEAITYWQRVEALAPYQAHEIKEKDPQKPLKGLQLPQLDYVPPTPEEIMGVPDWVQDLGLSQPGVPSQAKTAPGDVHGEATFGEGLFPSQASDEEEESVPDWLRDMDPSDESAGALLDEPELGWSESGTAEEEEALGEMVPDWLRDSGFGETDDETEEPVIEFDLPADKEPSPPPTAVEEEEEESGAMPDWLSGTVDWGAEESKAPDAKKNDGPEDDWLPEAQSLEAKETLIAGSAAAPAQVDDASASLDVADFDFEDKDEMPDWLQSVQEDEDAGRVGVGKIAEPVSPPDFNWDQLEDALTPTDQEPSTEGSEDSFPPALTDDDDFPFDWVSEESTEPETVPQRVHPAAEIEPDSTATLEKKEESVMAHSDEEFGITGDKDELGEMPSDTEDALAWLEQLAAKQGAPLEELPSLQDQDEDSIPPADEIPDWLKDIAPSSEEPAAATLPTPAEEQEVPDWLKADDTQPTPTPSHFEPTRALGQTPPAETDIPDWLKGELETDQVGELDAELAALGADIGDMPTDPDGAMAWLEELAAGEGAPLEELASQAQEPEMEYLELPSRLSEEAELEAKAPSAEAETPAWLAKDAEPEPEAAELPEWLQDAPPEAKEEPAAPIAKAAPTDDTEQVPEDIDEAMLWLEQLAARQGAPLDELPSVSKADATVVEKPAWLEEEEPAVSPEPELEPAAIDEPELPEWLQEDAGEPLLAKATLEPAAEAEMEIPEWLQAEAPEAEPIEAKVEPIILEEPELPEWLQEEAPEPEPLAAEAELEAEPVAAEEPELPEWLREEPVEPEPVAAEAEPITLDEPELPEWLQDEAPEPEPVAAEAEVETEPAVLEAPDLPEWLREEAPETKAEPEPAEPEEPVELEAEPVAAEIEEPEEPIKEPEPKVPEPTPEAEPVIGLEALREQLTAEPADHVTRLALARALLDDEILAKALSEYGELVNTGQELEEISQDLERVVKAHPTDTLARRLLGDTFMKQGDLSKALDAYRQALEHI